MNEIDMHRHLFVLHRHAPIAGHKPNPGRWHVHMWWKHSHATVVCKLNRALCRAEHAEETIARLESEIKTLQRGLAAIHGSEIFAERQRQDEKWGGPEHDDNHTGADWCGFIIDHAAKARRAEMGERESDADLAGYRRRLIEVAALAVAAVDSLDRQYPGLRGIQR